MVIPGRGTCVVMSTKAQSSPSPAQPRATQRSSRTAQPSPALPTATQPSMVVSAKAQINSLPGPNPAQPCPAQPSRAQPSEIQPSPSPAQPCPAQPSPAQPSLLGAILNNLSWAASTLVRSLTERARHLRSAGVWFVLWLSEPSGCVGRACGFVHCPSKPGAGVWLAPWLSEAGACDSAGVWFRSLPEQARRERLIRSLAERGRRLRFCGRLVSFIA